MNKKKAKKQPSRIQVQSKRPSFKILRGVTIVIVSILLILAIISIILKYYLIVTGR